MSDVVERLVDAGAHYAAFLQFCAERGLSPGTARGEWRRYLWERLQHSAGWLRLPSISPP